MTHNIKIIDAWAHGIGESDLYLELMHNGQRYKGVITLDEEGYTDE